MQYNSIILLVILVIITFMIWNNKKSNIIFEGNYGIIVMPNHKSDNFLISSNKYVSKLTKKRVRIKYKYEQWPKDQIENEIKVLKRIKTFDPQQQYFITYEDISYIDNDEYWTNIIMIHGGKTLTDNEYNDLFLYENKQKLLNIINILFTGIFKLHKNNIIHKDINLNNILFDKNLNPRIIDFGLSLTRDNFKKSFDSYWTSKDFEYFITKIPNYESVFTNIDIKNITDNELDFIWDYCKKLEVSKLLFVPDHTDTEYQRKLIKISHKLHDDILGGNVSITDINALMDYYKNI